MTHNPHREFEDLIAESWQSLCDKDDRTSPEEYPDMCLITRDELAAYMADALEALTAKPAVEVRDLFEAMEAALVEGTPTLSLQGGRIWIDGETAFDAKAILAALSAGADREGWKNRGVYVASRASKPTHPAMWRRLRDELGYPIISTWIDEAGEGETADLGELWSRIQREVTSSRGVVLYVEPDDFPLKGAFIEVGMALAAGLPVFVVAPGVELEPRACRPLGSWMRHPSVCRFNDVQAAFEALPASPPRLGAGSSTEGGAVDG